MTTRQCAVVFVVIVLASHQIVIKLKTRVFRKVVEKSKNVSTTIASVSLDITIRMVSVELVFNVFMYLNVT